MNGVRVARVDKVRYLMGYPPDLDAVFLVLPAAEKWGSRAIIGKAQVLSTRPDDQKDGMPRYVVTGVAMGPTDPRGPVPETTMLLRIVFEAIDGFNRENNGPIRKVGFWGVNLLNGVTPAELRDILKRTRR